MSQITSSTLKRLLASHLYYRLNYVVICDEFNFMDLLGIRRNGYAVEFEVKISKSDFDREMRIIRSKPGEIERYSKDWAKWSKHHQYLGGNFSFLPQTPMEQVLGQAAGSTELQGFVPNDFYFYVPESIAAHAVISCQGLPYGVIRMSNAGDTWDGPYKVLKKATKLHSNPVSAETYAALAHALTIRSRVLNGVEV